MTGPEHYRKAEELLEDAESSGAEWPVRKAQVHAILALAAATALHGVTDHRHWFEATGAPHADG
jgi:hypothetical protein